ncbi:hypothetical protein KSP40_PGU007585 [Platanthera guangdongensis]|uniref:CAP-Gly domain-containing protein n=1 Tax=Platanthera guangdongensis TaxID=2320717 RepID=A0ABR2MGP1_9ASPA
MCEGKKCSTPLEHGQKLQRDEGRVLHDPLVFRALVGSLIYLTITRPDIAYAVGRVSRYMAEPRQSHLVAAKHILKYVKSTSDMGLLYRRDSDFALLGYTDADYDGDSDDRRSTSGYVFTCGSSNISWCSKKQDSVSVSTTEAEYKASALAAREAIWLRRLIEDVHEEVQEPTLLRGDNESALKLVNNPVCHTRTMHIEIDHHFIREKVLEGSLLVGHVRSEDNLADIFTKPLSKGPFERLRSLLGLITTSHFKGECQVRSKKTLGLGGVLPTDYFGASKGEIRCYEPTTLDEITKGRGLGRRFSGGVLQHRRGVQSFSGEAVPGGEEDQGFLCSGSFGGRGKKKESEVAEAVEENEFGLCVGRRVHTVGNPQRIGTVLYIGPVESQAGEWVGVEWDGGNGKHDGVVAGVRYFMASREMSASLVRSKSLSIGISFLKALHLRYRGESTKEEEGKPESLN